MNQESKLMAHMMGFRKAVYAAHINNEQKACEPFMAGHEAGRKAVQWEYAKACATYGCELSPLRDDALSK